jgi:hypothetical protein
MSLFKRSFKISKLKNNYWHVIEIGVGDIKTFPRFEDAITYIRELLKEEE